jgi:hypothetical protein
MIDNKRIVPLSSSKLHNSRKETKSRLMVINIIKIIYRYKFVDSNGTPCNILGLIVIIISE